MATSVAVTVQAAEGLAGDADVAATIDCNSLADFVATGVKLSSPLQHAGAGVLDNRNAYPPAWVKPSKPPFVQSAM